MEQHLQVHSTGSSVLNFQHQWKIYLFNFSVVCKSREKDYKTPKIPVLCAVTTTALFCCYMRIMPSVLYCTYYWHLAGHFCRQIWIFDMVNNVVLIWMTHNMSYIFLDFPGFNYTVNLEYLRKIMGKCLILTCPYCPYMIQAMAEECLGFVL